VTTTVVKVVANPVPITIPDDATLVHITVREDAGRFSLGVFPSRHGETEAFYTDERSKALRHLERPREVVWVAHGLPNNMKLVIMAKPKSAGTGLLVEDKYTILAPDRSTNSQPVLNEGTWRYSIFLRNAADGDDVKALASVDPDVTIHPDP